MADKEALERNGLISDREYPLNRVTYTSKSDYKGMRKISSEYEERKTTSLYTGHATEIFLYPVEII